MLAGPIRLAFTHDKPGYWPAWNIDWADQSKPPRAHAAGPARIEVVEAGPVRAAVRIEREAEGSRFSQTVRLAAGGAGGRVEFSDVIDWHSTECNLKVVFPLAVSNPQATYNWEAGTVRRGNNDPKKYEVPFHQWFDLTAVDESYGVTVLSPFKYGTDKLDDNTVRLTLLRTPGTHNDDYGDQSTQDWGRHEIIYGLAGHSGGWCNGQTDWQAMRLEQPLAAFQTVPHPGPLGRSLSAAATGSPQVRVLAMKQAEDGDELVVRLVELRGERAEGVMVQFPAAVTAAREIDGQEQSLGPATVSDGRLAVDFGPYAIRSFALRLAPAPEASAASRGTALSMPYNCCVATNDNELTAQGFDAKGHALPAEMLPERLEDAGVTFKLGAAGNGRDNAVSCRGQVIELPGGVAGRLYLLAAADGDRCARFAVDGCETELEIQDWSGFIGQWDNRIWRGAIAEMAFRWSNQYAGLTPGYIKRAPVAWFSSHRHDNYGENDAYRFAYLFRYSIDLPAGARELALPDDPHIKILAVTAVQDEAADCRAACPLYDVLASKPQEQQQ